MIGSPYLISKKLFWVIDFELQSCQFPIFKSPILQLTSYCKIIASGASDKKRVRELTPGGGVEEERKTSSYNLEF